MTLRASIIAIVFAASALVASANNSEQPTGRSTAGNPNVASSYISDAEFYQRRAASLRREAEFLKKRAETSQAEAQRYLERNDKEHAESYTRRAEKAVEQYLFNLVQAEKFDEKANIYTRKALLAME